MFHASILHYVLNIHFIQIENTHTVSSDVKVSRKKQTKSVI